jgi:2,4-dienoyl-CoA reductase-like NADH-dependent reductase (Old Yellow Enzyme family)
VADLWSPLSVGPVQVKNRVRMTPTSPLYGENEVLSDRQIAYYAERARGGVGMVTTEQQFGHRHSMGGFRGSVSALKPEAIPRFAELAELAHAEDCRVFVELLGAGAHDSSYGPVDGWHPVWAPSRIPSAAYGETPVVMDSAFIAELVVDFAQAAANVQLGGLDGVELHGTHGYLIQQFLSPIYNRRIDRYGGSVERRCQLALDIAGAIRDRTGEFALGIRLSLDEFLGPAGIGQAEAEEQLDVLAGSGLFDYFDISCGGFTNIHRAVAPMGAAEDGFLVEHARRATEIVAGRALVFAVGKIRDLELAERIVADGDADMVGMTRAHIADPLIVEKALTGRRDEIVKCVGANECVARLFKNRELVCMMNPATGRERVWGSGTLRPATVARRVAVVGGGPAGMRVAAVAAERGHDVGLYERESELGGHLNLLKRLPTRGEWQTAIENLGRPLDALGVRVLTGVEATPQLLSSGEPDAIVLATGATWDRTGFSPLRIDRDLMPGVEQSNVVDIESAIKRALEDSGSLGDRVIILDEGGSYLPFGLAELLSSSGCGVEIVTRHLVAGEELAESLDLPYVLPRLIEAGVRISAQHFIERIDGASVELYGIWGGPRRLETSVDTVVLAMLRTPRDRLFEELSGSGPELHRIGDALAPRRTAVAIYEGEKLGREL